MKEKVLTRPKLIAVIKSSGVESSVEWIDLENKRCKTTAGLVSDIDDFEFIDSRDYDELRGEYAGRAMQTMIPTVIKAPKSILLGKMQENECSTLSELVAKAAVRYADALISELKRPKDSKEMFGV